VSQTLILLNGQLKGLILSKMLHHLDVWSLDFFTPMVLRSKYDEAIQREESLKAEQEASRQFLATQRDDFD
jgi:hypothetical protein